jgi:hypothetical protein
VTGLPAAGVYTPVAEFHPPFVYVLRGAAAASADPSRVPALRFDPPERQVNSVNATGHLRGGGRRRG